MASPLDAYEAAHHTLTHLREADMAAHRKDRQWEERLEALWGVEPPYTPQAEDASSWFFGRFYYTWIGDTMYKASQESLTAEQLPGPVRRFRACNVGRELSREMRRQHARRRLWDCFIGSPVSLKVRWSLCPPSTESSSGDGYGELRFIGPVRQLTQDSGELFAGVAWRSAPRSRRPVEAGKPATRPGYLLTAGEVEGEQLFALNAGDVVASVERVGDLQFTLMDPEELSGWSDEARRLCARMEHEQMPSSVQDGGHRPQPFAVGRGIVRSLGHYILPAVPYCILKNVLTLVSPIVLQAYISYIEAVTGGRPGGDGGGGNGTDTNESLSDSSASFPAFRQVFPLSTSLSSSSYSAFSSLSEGSSSSSGDASAAAAAAGMSSLGYGLFLTFLLFLVPISESIASNRFSILCNRSNYTTRHALIALLFEKCLTISSKALSDPAMGAGRLVNMMSSDVGRIAAFAQMFWSMLSAPCMLTVSIYLLHRLVGWSAFVGAGVLVLFMPLQGVIMVFMFKAFRAKAKATDARIKATNEFISGIRVAKFMSWEPSFVIGIEEKRGEELRQLRNIQFMYMIVNFFMNAAPSVVVASVFFTYSAAGHTLTPSVVFPVITLLWIMEMPFFMIPMTIQMILRCAVSARRVNRFLDCDDTDPSKIKDTMRRMVGSGGAGGGSNTGSTPEEQQLEDECWRQATAVWFRRANLTAYSPVPLENPNKRNQSETQAATGANDNNLTASPLAATAPAATTSAAAKKDDEDAFFNLRPKVLLRDVNLRIPRGKLTLILGPTGSGKSTLLDSLVGAVDVTSGRVLATRSVAYVPQQAWIMNATLRENVLFFSDEDPARLARALDCSQLRADLSLLADGLETEIGEKGINLSGGQKARVGLARAVYADKELYLLDDPLSALDAHVGERVMRECVLGELAGKTRVLATHQVQVVDQADMVVLVEDGRVVFSGTPEEFHQKGLSVGERGEPMSSTNHRQDAHELHDGQAAQEDESTAKSSEKEGTPDSLPVDDVDRLSKSPSTATGPIRSSSLGEKDGAVDTALPSTRDATDTAAAVPVAGPTERGRLLSDEEMASGAVSRAAYTRYIEACGGWCTSISILVLYAVTELVVAGPYLWLSFWSTDAFGLTTNRYLVVYALLTLGDVLCSPARYLSITTAGRRAGRALHSRLLRSVACGTLQFFDTTPTGRIINRFSKDMEQLDDDLPGDISFFLSSAASVLSVVVILVSSQYLVLLLLLPLAFVYLHLMRFYNAANRHLQRITNVSHSAIFSVLGETLSGRWTIEAYGKGHAVMAKALRSLDTIYASAFMMTVGNKWLSVRIESMTAVVTATVGGLGVVACHLPWLMGSRVGMLALSLLMARRLNWVLNSMIMQVASVEADMNAVERISAYVDAIDQEAGTLTSLEKEIAVQLKRPKVTRVTSSSSSPFPAAPTSDPMPGSREDDMGDGGENAPLLRDGEENRPAEASVAIDVAAAPVPQEASTSTDTAARLPDEDAIHRSSTAGSLELRHVDMRYRPGLPLVLRDVSFAIAPRQKVGVVGRTGSGKSTLLLAFLRLVEVCGGELVVCGRPAHEYDVRSLRRLFSMIPQDPLLFDGTVRSNVDPFGEASDAECWAALGHVGMAVRVRGEAGGLDGRVAEGGANFSVGQRQLLCLARALLKRGSAFLLMDEATANVDPALDRQIQQTVARTFRGYTVITIAHRLHTVAGYDVIVMMDGGRVVACGSPRALVSDAASPFAELVRSMGEEAQRKFFESLKPEEA